MREHLHLQRSGCQGRNRFASIVRAFPHGFRLRFAATIVALFGALPLSVGAQSPPITLLQYSADTGANIIGPAQFAARNDYVVDDTLGHRARVIIGLPDTVNLRDFQIEPNGDLLFCIDVGVTLGGTYFAPADVVKYAGGNFSKAFDSQAALVPAGVHCDGVARSGISGALLLSFDRAFRVGVLTILPADVVAVSGASFGAKVLDARALGLSDRLNVDAVDSIGTTTDLLLSFDTGGNVGGVSFTAADILQLHLADGVWSKRYRMLDFSDRWATANLDGLAASNDVIFRDGFE